MVSFFFYYRDFSITAIVIDIINHLNTKDDLEKVNIAHPNTVDTDLYQILHSQVKLMYFSHTLPLLQLSCTNYNKSKQLFYVRYIYILCILYCKIKFLILNNTHI